MLVINVLLNSNTNLVTPIHSVSPRLEGKKYLHKRKGFVFQRYRKPNGTNIAAYLIDFSTIKCMQKTKVLRLAITHISIYTQIFLTH